MCSVIYFPQKKGSVCHLQTRDVPVRLGVYPTSYLKMRSQHCRLRSCPFVVGQDHGTEWYATIWRTLCRWHFNSVSSVLLLALYDVWSEMSSWSPLLCLPCCFLHVTVEVAEGEACRGEDCRGVEKWWILTWPGLQHDRQSRGWPVYLGAGWKTRPHFRRPSWVWLAGGFVLGCPYVSWRWPSSYVFAVYLLALQRVEDLVKLSLKAGHTHRLETVPSSYAQSTESRNEQFIQV